MVYRRISSDMKECALRLWEAGWAKEDVCSVLTVSRSSLYRWAQIFDEFGSVTPPPSPMRGRPRIIGMAAMTTIKEIYARNSDAYLDELQWHLAIHHDIVISISALQETLVRAGLTRKVLHKIASERDEARRAEFMHSFICASLWSRTCWARCYSQSPIYPRPALLSRGCNEQGGISCSACHSRITGFL
ncbi:hypothetical protein GALMADRAFT_1346228 [Galerina marginata CBS 339.88]|uniref:Uncharacterized protein n=1 Tax=Galerina marginata (strain CBS 339.88) TaxID=685588 RepID=A0A067SJK6_GALM3|nr:hypothetical protein GALMADRAFT_1346228 [Galerina marginata CBS 339.88]